MSVKIFYGNKSALYNPNKCLETQLKGSKEVVIDYDPKDSSIEKFIDGLEKLCDSGMSNTLNLKVVHNNHIEGASTRKKAGELEKSFDVNRLIKMMASSYSEMDKKLEELSEMCSGKNCRVK